MTQKLATDQIKYGRTAIKFQYGFSMIKYPANKELVKTPLKCIQYVITHELCHLMERNNHTPRFYALLDRVLPDWKETKNQLNLFGNIVQV